MNASDGLLTLGRWTGDRARIDGDRTAILDRGVRTTYRELDDRAGALAERLRAGGYRPGDVIATLTGNTVDHIVLFFACAQAGLALAPISWRLRPGEIAGQLDLLRPALFVTESVYASLARDAQDLTGEPVPLVELGEIGIESIPVPPAGAGVPLPVHGDAGRADRPVRDDDPLLLILTATLAFTITGLVAARRAGGFPRGGREVLEPE